MLKTTDIKSIGQAYLEVLGEIKKINEMDPTDHVKKNDETGKFCVYDSEGKKVKEFDSEEEANEYATKKSILVTTAKLRLWLCLSLCVP